MSGEIEHPLNGKGVPGVRGVQECGSWDQGGA